MSSRNIIPRNTGVLHHASNICCSAKPYSVKRYKSSISQILLYVAACDIGMAYCFLHFITEKVQKYKYVFIQVRSTTDYKRAVLNDSQSRILIQQQNVTIKHMHPTA